MINRMRFLGMNPDKRTDPGVELLVVENVSSPPREYEIVRVNGTKCQVVEGGVLWEFNERETLVTVVVTAVEYSDAG